MFAFAGAATAFVPSTTATGPRFDRLVAGSLHGDVELASFGIASLSGDGAAPMRALHVRETFANRGDNLPWVVDVSAARMWLGGVTTEVGAVFVNSDVPTLPLAVIGRGQRRVLDLYFPVAADVDEDALPYFSLTYRVSTADHHFEAHAMLARSNRWPSREERGAEPGWGARWWANPAYPWAQYRHRPGYASPRPPRKIEIIHVPRGFYEAAPVPLPLNVAEEEWPRIDECNDW